MDGIKVFISYSHIDESLRDELWAHLMPLQRLELIETWYDRKIGPGDEWKIKIDENLEGADIILLLVSADFMASDYCYEKELKHALVRHESGEARLIPVIVRDVSWRGSSIARLQALPIDGRAVTLWEDRDAAWRNVVDAIEIVAKELRAINELRESTQEGPLQPPPSRVPFTNREDEMADTLFSTATTYHLLDAPAGYGKTELLKQLEQRFKRQNWYCAYMVVDEKSSDRDLANDLAKQFGIDLSLQGDIPLSLLGLQLGGRLKQKWQSGDKKEGVVLLVDFEKRLSISILSELIERFIPYIEKSLRVLDDFAPTNNRFRVIIAGRYLVRYLGTKHTLLPNRVLKLSPFSFDVIRNSAIKYLPGQTPVVIDQLSAHLFFFTGGHPGCMARILEMYRDEGVPPDEFFQHYGSTIWQDVLRESIESILIGVPRDHKYLRKVLDRVSVFRFLDFDVLKELNNDLIPAILDEYHLAEALTATYLLDWKGRFLRDGITRRLLTIKLRNETPDEFSKRCEQAMKICTRHLRQSSARSPEIWTIEYLYQSLQRNAVNIQDQERRFRIQSGFSKAVLKALGIFYDRKKLGGSWRGEKEALRQAIEEDWEFQFTINYYLRDNNYNEDPYNKMLQQIDQFFA